MSKQTILALVGMSGSGKGTCTDHIAKKYGYPLIHLGNMVYEEVQRRGLDNVKDESFVRADMRKQEGLAVLARRAAEKAKTALADDAPGVVLDGVYSWSEDRYLRSVFGDSLTTIAVAAPRQLRYQRATTRKDGHRAYTSTAQIEQRDIDEIENIEKGGPIAFADYTIVNDGTPEEMIAKLDSIVDSL